VAGAKAAQVSCDHVPPCVALAALAVCAWRSSSIRLTFQGNTQRLGDGDSWPRTWGLTSALRASLPYFVPCV
jgi:hypothetical protein